MQLFNYLETNIFAFVILFLIFLNIQRQSKTYTFEQKLYLGLIIFNTLLLFFDSIMWIIDGKAGFLAREINIFVSAIYYILSPIPCMLWSFYADFQIYRDENRFRKILFPLLIPATINAILTLASLYGGFMFFIDRNNIYHRGELMLVMAFMCYSYLIYTFIQLIKEKSKIKKNDYPSLLSFAIPPFIGGIIQTVYYGVSLIWICMSISLLIVFINVQNHQLNTDHLTGLYNRRQMENYLSLLLKNEKNLLAGILIDINFFKEINDLFGHTVGDQALEYTGEILKKSFRKDDFISRYGGDEFVIIFQIQDRSDLINTINRIKENIAQFNDRKIAPYKLSLSIGYDIFDHKSGMTTQQFIRHIDSLMYEDKKNYKTFGIMNRF